MRSANPQLMPGYLIAGILIGVIPFPSEVDIPCSFWLYCSGFDRSTYIYADIGKADRRRIVIHSDPPLIKLAYQSLTF